jgi:uncharacterized protein (TIGR02594 family)
MYDFLKNERSPRLLVEAVKLIGTKEVPGTKNNPEIMLWAKEVGLDRVYTADSIPWCGLFMAYVAKKANVDGVKIPLRALSWRKFGNPSPVPMLGDVLCFSRNGGGHVGIYVGEDSTCYHVLGGNQSDMVNVTRILKSRLVEARRTAWKIAQPANVRVIQLTAKGEISKNEL